MQSRRCGRLASGQGRRDQTDRRRWRRLGCKKMGMGRKMGCGAILRRQGIEVMLAQRYGCIDRTIARLREMKKNTNLPAQTNRRDNHSTYTTKPLFGANKLTDCNAFALSLLNPIIRQYDEVSDELRWHFPVRRFLHKGPPFPRPLQLRISYCPKTLGSVAL
jgi:hypothetical protein